MYPPAPIALACSWVRTHSQYRSNRATTGPFRANSADTFRQSLLGTGARLGECSGMSPEVTLPPMAGTNGLDGG